MSKVPTRAGRAGGAVEESAGAGQRAAMRRDEIELIEDVVQICLDLAGLVDPTPTADTLGALNEWRRGNFWSGAINIVGWVPYIGDLAKAGKLPRYLRSVERAIDLAKQNPVFAKKLRPHLERLLEVLDLLPANVSGQVDSMRAKIARFLTRPVVVKRAADALPDISSSFKFGERILGGNTVKWASGRLGVPGTVKVHRSRSAQSAISSARHGSHPGDHAGHLIGARFGAPGDARNLAPQNYVTNSSARKADDWASSQGSRLGTYRRLEDTWAEKLKNGTGIEVRIEDVIRKGETRPYQRRVEWAEIAPDGKRTNHSLTFLNTHTPASRAKQGVPATPGKPGGADIINLDAYRNSRGE